MRPTRFVQARKACEVCERLIVRDRAESLRNFRRRRTCGLACQIELCSRKARHRKLDERSVQVLRDLAPYFPTRLLGRGFGVRHETVWLAVNHQTWARL